MSGFVKVDETWTKEQLQLKCHGLALDNNGTKGELIHRINSHFERLSAKPVTVRKVPVAPNNAQKPNNGAQSKRSVTVKNEISVKELTSGMKAVSMKQEKTSVKTNQKPNNTPKKNPGPSRAPKPSGPKPSGPKTITINIASL
uniref:SAP domain-containing protein n=2 Tax=Panagrolaimus sp. JU765 TaxID=591449 RepID=A0AC34QUT5_9BILA